MRRRSDHLWKRGDVWYLRLSIPPSMRHLFLSSKGRSKGSEGQQMVRVVERLSDSKSVAEVMAAERVAVCKNIFAQIKAGIITTPQQVRDALEPSEPDVALQPGFDRAMRDWYASPEMRRKEFERRQERLARWFEEYGEGKGAFSALFGEQPASTAGETINQATEAWLAELTRDKTTAPQDTTLGGHRLRVRAFVDAAGDVPLTKVTVRMASDFLAGLDVGSNRTRNAYSRTLRSVFECARRRGQFTGEDPFDGMKAKVAGSSYQPFTVAELQTLFDALPRKVEPVRHTPDTALPWVALMALYTGMRLEEIAQLTVADVREETANGARVWCVDVHNGGSNKLKNETSARLIPIHSELVRLGFLDYVKALKAGPLFPGLTRRASKGGKVGARVGELFRKRLVALGLKRDGLCFHSLRHCVAGRLDAAGVPQSDAARVLGHAVAGMSYGTYSQAGPGLKRVAAVVQEIKYDGLRL
jgi:integrase